MFQNYVVVALRNLAKHRLYSFINIAGLAVALASAILIMLFVRDELSWDKWIPGQNNLYRAEGVVYPPGRDPITASSSMYPLADVLKNEISGVVETTRLTQQNSAVKYGDKSFFEPINPVGANFFQVIQIPLLKGDPATVLARPDTAVITQSIAKKYFGDEDPTGKVFIFDTGATVEVTGLIADLPHNTHLDSKIFIPLGSKADRAYGPDGPNNPGANNWLSFNYYTYFRIAPGVAIDSVVAQFPDMVRKYVRPEPLGLPAGSDTAELLKLNAVAFDELHFSTSQLTFGDVPAGDWGTIYGFTIIAALILLIACINFMNLATARATQRAREVAMRKVVGASRRQLIVQFLGESVMIAIFSLIVALALVELLLPVYSTFVDRPIALSYLRDWDVALGALAMAVITGLLGGIYPALVLSGFRPATVLKSNRSGQSGSGNLRAALVILQFSISIGLGITAAVVYGQTLYARSFDVGLKRDNMLILTGIGRDQVEPVRETLRNELKANPDVISVVASQSVPFDTNENNTLWMVSDNPADNIIIRQMDVEPEFFEAYGIKLIAGRFLSKDRGEDRRDVDVEDFNAPEPENLSVLINEAAVRRLGFKTPQEAIGKTVRESVGPGSESETTAVRVIVGVVADAHFDSLRQPILPTRYVYTPDGVNHFTVSIKGENIQATTEFVRQTWARLVPDLPIRLAFLDDSYQALYAQDAKRGEMFGLFTVIAIVVACLGLFGLASFTAERRTKEIGIRKVFGARVRDIVGLLLWQFSKPVLIANLIAWPVAWYYLHDWLKGFAYRIDLGPGYFLAAGLGALVIAWGTVALHSMRVARSKPVNALRYE